MSKKKETSPSKKFQESKPIQKKRDFVSWIVFLFTLAIVLITLVSVVFPALISSNNSILQEIHELGIIVGEAEPYETGIWTGPFLAANLIVFGIAILYFKKRLPNIISQFFKFLFDFEISKKVTIIILVSLLIVYIVASAGELLVEETWEDYPAIKERVENWSIDQVTKRFEPHVKYFLTWSSMELFGLLTVIPFLASIGLLITVYFITKEISKKRFAGIIAFVILLQSNLFLSYDTTVSYTNFWVLFYLLSLFMVYKFWPLSPVFYLLSLPSKPLTAMFLPMLLFFIYRSTLSRKKKIIAATASTAIILAGALVAVGLNADLIGGPGPEGGFDSNDFWVGFTSFSYQLRFDGLVLLFILPLIVGLFLVSRNGFKQADSILVLIAGVLFSAPLLTGFTELTTQPYRFVPLIAFFAIGVGVLLSKRNSQ